MLALRIYTTIITFLFISQSWAIDFTRVNVSWQYDPTAEIKTASRIVQNGNNLSIFLSLKSDSIRQWNLSYLLQKGYESEAHVKFSNLISDTLIYAPKHLLLQLDFEKPSEDLFVVKIEREGAVYYYDISLSNGQLPHPSIYPKSKEGFPILNNYINTSTVTWEGTEQLYVTEYVEDFPEAIPPFGEMKALAPTVQPEETFVLRDQKTFENGNFYVVMKDSLTSEGITFVKTPPYYPEFRKLDELAESMVYILNDAEKKGLQSASNPKQAFDSFWIKTFATKFRARNAIRDYYSWVKQANRLFTDFKEGWKTDRGMLFIVYGVPDEVYRSNSKEEWYYDKGASFEFNVISTYFSSRTYALKRKVEYEDQWLSYLAAIRRGSND